MRVIQSAVAVFALCAFVPPAFALDNDPVLRRLCIPAGSDAALPCGDNVVANNASFKEIARELGMALAPRLLAPAETLGVNGFAFNLQYAFTSIDKGAGYWQETIEDRDPPGSLMTAHLDVKKGLPYSFEVGAHATYLVNSELWAYGGSLKFAPNEAVGDFPVDFAIRGTLTRVTGSSELQMTTAGLDVILSRSFGVGGVASIAPYMAYSPAWIYARSGVLDSTPANFADPENSFVLADQDILIHRFVLGTRFLIGAVNFTPEVALAKGQQTYGVNLGLDF